MIIDIDGTVVNSFKKWDIYCLERYDKTWKEISKIDNLAEDSHNSYLEFWKLPDLYDDLEPYENCVETIRNLSEKHDILFVSSCIHEHKKSKERFLEKYFETENVNYKFIDTSHKHLLKANYIIDDYYAYLETCQKVGMTPIQFNNDYNKKKFDLYFDWKQIDDFFKL